jgi:ATP-dependent protease ClpP protease subunit
MRKNKLLLRKGYSITVKADKKEAEVWIYEDIGEGWFGGISSKQFAADIKALGDVEKITLRLNSQGGVAFEGIAMYNVLKNHKARVVVQVDGLAASAASIIAMAGDEINMAENAMMMIHEAAGVTMGPAADHRKTAQILEKLNESLITTYATHAKVDEKKIAKLMSDETWMSAEDAIVMGFADAMTEALEIAAYGDFGKYKYKHLPQNLAACAKNMPSQPTLEEEAEEAPAVAVAEQPAAPEPIKVPLFDPMTYEDDRQKKLRAFFRDKKE